MASIEAHSCSCVQDKGDLEEVVASSYRNSSSVLLAKVESIENINPTEKILEKNYKFSRVINYERQRVRFVALESFNGKHGKRFFTDSKVKCGYHFVKKAEYLLYLKGPDINGYYQTNICSRTKPITINASDEIDILRRMSASKEFDPYPQKYR